MVRNTVRRRQRDTGASVRGFFSRWDAELGGIQKDLEEEARRLRRSQRRLKADPDSEPSTSDQKDTSPKDGGPNPAGFLDTKERDDPQAGARQYLLEWQKHDQAYRKFQEQNFDDDSTLLTFADIPWPPCASDVLEFLESMWSPGHPRQAYRIACRRWHPDKFLQFHGPRVSDEDRDRVTSKLNDIFQSISAQWQRTEERRKIFESVI